MKMNHPIQGQRYIQEGPSQHLVQFRQDVESLAYPDQQELEGTGSGNGARRSIWSGSVQSRVGWLR